MLKIGFVDHHLNNFHANKFLSLLHGPLAGEGARVTAAWESDPVGEDWCARNDVPRAGSAAAVAEQCDALMVLAPDDVHRHLELCRLVFPAGKPCVVDKFLAPTWDEANQIAGLAQQHRVPLFSASALRFAVELEAALAELRVTPVEAFARGMGDWDNYGVHTLSLVIAAMGIETLPVRVLDTGSDAVASVTLQYQDGRRAWVDVRSAENQWDALPWTFGFRAGGRYVTGTVTDFDGFYSNLMRRAVRFFKTGESPVSVLEMTRIPAVLEGARRSGHRDGVWVDV
jgi:predicted dehydrogenase